MLRFRHWLGVVAVLMCASVAMAQRPGGGGPGGPPRGGFGGGFGGGGFGGPPSLLNLAGNEAVQKELGLKEDQVSKIRGLNDDARKEMQGVFGAGGFGGGQDLSDEERQKRRNEMQEKMAAATKKVNETILPKLNETLTDSQRERLQQIAWQAAGPQVVQDAKMADALKLSKEQKEKLAAIVKEASDKQAELFGGGRGGPGGGGDFQERFAKIREVNEARDKKLAEVLTADQKEQLEKLKGKPFDVAALRGGFGGPGGPGRGPGGPGGGANPGGRPQRQAQGGDKKADDKKSDK